MLGVDEAPVIDRRAFTVSEVALPGRGDVVLILAGPAAPGRGGRRRWQREVQVLVDERGLAQVWVDGAEIAPG